MSALSRSLLIIICLTFSSCQTTDSGDTTVDLNPVVGLIGMAVDGDDKDDYEHFFENDDDCECRDKSNSGIRISFD